jgi:predicted transposase YdaD
MSTQSDLDDGLPPIGQPPPDQPPPDQSTPGKKSPGGQVNLHDSLFRRYLGVPENAASQVRALLPPDLTARLDLGRMIPVSGSFVDEDFDWRHCDLLFRTTFDDRDAYVYLLLEHQSRSDPLMAYRMLRYVIRIWEQHLREHSRARLLPAVIPLVVYHDRRRWTAPVQTLDLIDLDPIEKNAVERYLPRFEFLLDDLTKIDKRQLKDRELTSPARITLVLLKIAPGNPNVAAELLEFTVDLRAILDGPNGYQEFIGLMKYTGGVSEAPASELHALAASLGPDAEEAYLTTADTFRAEGRAEGRSEGETLGQAKALIQMLSFKFGPLADGVIRTVRGATSDQLQAWIARAMTAETLDQVFA